MRTYKVYLKQPPEKVVTFKAQDVELVFCGKDEEFPAAYNFTDDEATVAYIPYDNIIYMESTLDH